MKKAIKNAGSMDQKTVQPKVPKRVQFAELNQASTSKPSENPEPEKDKYREMLDQTIEEHLNDNEESHRVRYIMATSTLIALKIEKLQLETQVKYLMSLNTDITKQNVLIRHQLISKNDMIETLKKSSSSNIGALKMVGNHQNVLVDGVNNLETNRVAIANEFVQMKEKCIDTVAEYREKLAKFENEESQKDDLIVELRNQLKDKENLTEELNAKDRVISDINKKLSVLSDERRRDEESTREKLDKVRQNYAVDKAEWTNQMKTLTENLQKSEEKNLQLESNLNAMTESRNAEESQLKVMKQRLIKAMGFISNHKDDTSVLKKENSELQQKIESLQNELERQKDINDSSNLNTTFEIPEDKKDPFVASSEHSYDSELSFDQSYRPPVYKDFSYNISQNKLCQPSVCLTFSSNHPDVFKKRILTPETVDSTSTTTEAEGTASKLSMSTSHI